MKLKIGKKSKEEKEEQKAKKAAKKAAKKEKKAKKPKKEKAAKKPKKEKKGKGQAEAAAGKGSGKKKKLLMVVLLLVVVGGAAAFFLLRGKGGDSGEEGGEEERKSIDPPVEYELGDVVLPALPVALSESVIVYEGTLEEAAGTDTEADMESGGETENEAGVMPEDTGDAADTEGSEETEGTEETSEEEAAETEEASVESTAVAYLYEGLADPRGLIAAYAMLLTTKDIGFTYLDDAMMETSAPDYEAEEGAATLAQPAAEEGKLLLVKLHWDSETCSVTVDNPEGTIVVPTPPEVVPMSLTEAMDYFEAMPPSYLGLEGESMEEYNIYSVDGVVLVDGHPCIHLNVYSADEELGTNVIAGEYFLTSDRSHIYKMQEDGTVVEVIG